MHMHVHVHVRMCCGGGWKETKTYSFNTPKLAKSEMLLLVLSSAAAACTPTRRLPTPPLTPVRSGRHASTTSRDDLVFSPTPGCMTPLKPGKLPGHLAKCPVLAEQTALESSGYYCRAVNSGERLDDDEHDEASALTPALEARLRAAHAAECGGLLHTPATLALLNDEDGGGAKPRERERQRLQRRAIAEQLAALGLLGRGHCLVELGAGNGELSLAIAEAYPEEVRSDSLILLDRAAKPKGKSKGGRLAADPALAEAFGSVQRVKLSLEDVELAGLRDALAPGRHAI